MEEFKKIADNYISYDDDDARKKMFAKLRNILTTELESHKNDTDYEKYDIGYIQSADAHAQG